VFRWLTRSSMFCYYSICWTVGNSMIEIDGERDPGPAPLSAVGITLHCAGQELR